MGVASWSFVVRAVDGSGPARGACSRGRLGDCAVVHCCAGWLVAWCVWCRKHARCGGLLGLLWSWWSAGGGCPRVVWGWHAVGVLGQCALVAWPVFCCLVWVVGAGCGWVGCELYSGREHLTVRFLRQNCFLFCSCVFVVCFFERSVDALASGADEGRGGLRYSSGSRLAGCDPRVSEWGDPARVMSCHLHLNCIGCGG